VIGQRFNENMFKYQIIAENPEGIDWIIKAQHDSKFTKELFEEIVEDAIVYAMEEQYKKHGFAFKSGPEIECIIKFLRDKNFTFYEKEIEQTYYYNPFSDHIPKSHKLSQWFSRDKGGDKPLYMQ
jgi:hypothetical protein